MTSSLVFNIAYIVFGLLSGAASIYSAWVFGQQPFWARLAVVAAVILMLLLGGWILFALWPVLRSNPRRVTLVKAIRSVGLTDIESRNEGDRHLAPEALYTWPGLQEIVITGITAASSFQSHLGLIKRLLADKKDVYVLICREDTPSLDRLSQVECRPLRDDIAQVRRVIEAERLLDDERFHIRAFGELPTFTAVMLNGDLVPRGSGPTDARGVVRVQPRRTASRHHDGIVLQFTNPGRVLDGFNVFAADLREQWRSAQAWI